MADMRCQQVLSEKYMPTLVIKPFNFYGLGASPTLSPTHPPVPQEGTYQVLVHRPL